MVRSTTSLILGLVATAYAVPAQADPAPQDCAVLAAISADFKAGLTSALGIKDTSTLSRDKDKSEVMDQVFKHIWEKDPKTGKPRFDNLIDQFRRTDTRLHDAVGELQDPDAVQATQDFADGFDGYLAFLDKAMAGSDSASSEDTDQIFDQMGPSVKSFANSAKGFKDYQQQNCAETP